MLGTPRARINGLTFAAAWILSILVVGGLATLLIASGDLATSTVSDDGPVAWKLVFGVLLVLLGLRQWFQRPKDASGAEPPKWMSGVDRFTAMRAAALGLVLSVLNPKNLALVLGAAATLAAGDLSNQQEAVGLALFTIVASLGIVIPVTLYLALGERSEKFLTALKSWMTTNNAAIMLVVCLLIGGYLIVGELAA